MKTRIPFLLVLAMFLCGSAAAQHLTLTSGLSEDELADLTERATQKVNQFNNHLSLIAQPSRMNSPEERRRFDAHKTRLIRQCLNLFLGKGEVYEDAYGNKKEPVSIEVSSINKKTQKVNITTYPLKQYLNNMKRNRHRYDKIEITASDCFVVPESVRELDDGLYECVLTYTQWYRGERKDGNDYVDKTDKTVKVVFERMVLDGEVRWLIWLGDIYVSQTEGA